MRCLVVIVFTLFCSFCAYSQKKNETVDEKKIEATVDSVINTLMKNRKVPGVVFTMVSNGKIYKKAYGVADVEKNLPMNADESLIRIGSITKAFTFLALQQLLDQRKISGEDEVSNYIPFKISSVSTQPVRIKHLLNHTGGFDQIGKNRQAEDSASRISIEKFLQQELRIVWEPGTIATYDTYGATLAGYIIERVSGMPYRDYMAKNIFAPLGMKNTFVETPAAKRKNLSVGYSIENGNLTPAPYEWYVTLPASSIDATADDMGKLITALLNDGSNSHGRVLSKKMTEELKRDPGNPAALFSNGFWQNRLTNHYSIQHGGVMAGHETELFLFPEKNVGFFIGYNRSSESAPEPAIRYEIMFAFMRHLYPREMKALIENPNMPVNTDKLTGSYVSTLGCFTCQLGDGWPLRLSAVNKSSPGVLQAFGNEWYAIDSTHFQRKGTKQILSFHYVPSSGIRYMVFMNTSYVQLHENVLNELYPNGWENKPATQVEAMVHVSHENWIEATKAYEEMAAVDPLNARAFYYAGLYALYSNSSDRAIENFKKGIGTGNWLDTFTYYMAAAYAQKGDRNEALNHLKKATDLGYTPRVRMLTEQAWWSNFKGDEEIKKFFR